ncbi:hypothetical protein EDD36DRAFT_290686 [Exophiala viscosa]|uniref:Uncharacterized protein n=1 Tax=Exophiala viscosa TaxID=2486360 RepID=A0AAN6DTS3_9EURO|nr:hypothetical protein EDD36DRAFT_290686 [Exophiala viscosa]
MASARPASSLRQEDQSAAPNMDAQQQQQGGLDYRYGDSTVIFHSFDNDLLLIRIFLDDHTKCIAFEVPDYSQTHYSACLDLHGRLFTNAQGVLVRDFEMSDYNSLVAAVRHGVSTALDEVRLSQAVSLRSVRDAYWAGLAQVIVRAKQYAGLEPYIRHEMFEKILTSAIENSSGINQIQECNYELLVSSLTLDNDLYGSMWTAQLRLRDAGLARPGVVVVAPQTIINTEVRTVASEEDNRAALLESFRRAAGKGAEAQTIADADKAWAHLTNVMWALKVLEDGASGEESSDSDDDNDNDVDMEGEGGSAAEEEDWATEDDDDNDAGTAISSVAPGPSNAATAGPGNRQWNHMPGAEFPWRCLLCPAHKEAHHKGIKNKSSMRRHFDLTHDLDVQLPQSL